MKILHITYEPPAFPGGTGGQTRQYGLLKHLSRNHEIHSIFPCRSPNEQGTLREEVFSRINMPPPKTFFVKIIYLLLKHRHLSYPQFVRFFEGMNYSMMPFVRKEVEQGSYDLLNIEHTNIAHWLTALKLSIPTVLVAHNVKTIMWKRYYENGPEDNKRHLLQEYRKFEKYENTYLKYYDCLIAMSETDRRYLRSVCPDAKRIEVVPNGVDLDYFSPDPEKKEENYSLLFAGTMDHPPNEEAMIFFCRDVFPKVLKILPEATLTIVGRKPSLLIEGWGRQRNIRVTGFVPDSRPYFNRAQLFIVPLLGGSGTRLKILEAMAMGKAIVSTSIGAEGIEYTDGKNIVIADDADSFAESVLTLLQNQGCRKKMEDEAKRLVAGKYSWRILADKLEEIYIDVIKEKRGISGT